LFFEQCKALSVLFENLAPGGRLDRTGLRDFLSGSFDITDDVMMDFIFRAFDQNSRTGGVSLILSNTRQWKIFTDYVLIRCIAQIDEDEFINALSRILRGTMEEQIDFCYTCFDGNQDGSIDRDELHHCLRGCIHPGYGIDLEDIEDAENDIVEMVMKKLDVNGDGLVTRDDFRAAVHADPLMLQAVGPCIPEPNTMAAFLSTFTENYRSYSPAWITSKSNTASKEGAKELPDTMMGLTTDIRDRAQRKLSKIQKLERLGKYLGKPN